jgi:serine/threonine protein kinase
MRNILIRWSVGIMIYEMLAGTPTFRGQDLRQTYQRVLFSELEFRPEENFSQPARTLLTGLLKKDPTVRLGAWDNPPQDIMSSEFFEGIDWTAIFERR